MYVDLDDFGRYGVTYLTKNHMKAFGYAFDGTEIVMTAKPKDQRIYDLLVKAVYTKIEGDIYLRYKDTLTLPDYLALRYNLPSDAISYLSDETKKQLEEDFAEIGVKLNFSLV